MSFGDYILLGADVLQIKPKAIRQASADPEALRNGIIFVVIAGAAAALGSWTLPGLILFPLVYLVRVLAGATVAHFLSTGGFGGEGGFTGLLRPLALAHLLDWVLVVGLVINIVPLLGPTLMLLLALVITLWTLVVDTVIIETVYGLPRHKAVAVVGIVTALALAVLFLTGLFGAAVMSSWLVTG